MTKYVFQCRHCNRTSDRFNPYAHQRCACDSRNYHRVIVSYPPAYGGFTWEIHVRYNKQSYSSPIFLQVDLPYGIAEKHCMLQCFSTTCINVVEKKQ